MVSDRLIDFNNVKNPIAVEHEDYLDPQAMTNLPEIGHAVIAALDNIDFPEGSSLSVTEQDGQFFISKGLQTYLPDGTGRTVTSDGTSIVNVGFHDNSITAILTPAEDGSFKMETWTNHDGSYETSVIDAVQMKIFYDVDAQGNVARDAGISQGQEHTNTEHGQWVLEAGQAFESKLSRIMGGEFKNDVDAQRPANAAHSVSNTPELPDNVKTMSLDQLKSMETSPESIKPTQPVQGMSIG